MPERAPVLQRLRGAASRLLRPSDSARSATIAAQTARGLPPSSSDRINAPSRRAIAAGRAALSAQNVPFDPAALPQEDCAVNNLLALLWHPDTEIRRTAALGLAGGDGNQTQAAGWGYFVAALLRGLDGVDARGSGDVPATPQARYERVEAVLCALLDQSIGEIRGMSRMNYSFLSSALYLATLATCRDVVCAIGRLRAANAQGELCRLLWNLSQLSVQRCLNGQDMEALAKAAYQSLAALPPDRIPDFWHSLTHAALPRRLAVAPALAHFQDSRAVPYLLESLALPDTPSALAQQIVACLGRLGDVRAVPALTNLTASRDRGLRSETRNALAAIARSGRKQPVHTLLRAAGDAFGERDSETLLRSAPVNEHTRESPEALLRPSDSAASTLPEQEAGELWEAEAVQPLYSVCQPPRLVGERRHE